MRGLRRSRPLAALDTQARFALAAVISSLSSLIRSIRRSPTAGRHEQPMLDVDAAQAPGRRTKALTSLRGASARSRLRDPALSPDQRTGMIDTTPKAVTPGIRDFCLSFAPARPSLIRRRSDDGAKPSACFDNIAQGRPSGRRRRHRLGDLDRAEPLPRGGEYHCVWRNRSGGLIDAMPQPNQPKRMLYLRNDAATYYPACFRSKGAVMKCTLT